MIQEMNTDKIKLLTPHFQRRNEGQFALTRTISTALASPGLVGFWPMSSVDAASTGDVFDISGNQLTLTNNNTVEFGNDNLVPYAKFVIANTEYLDRPDEASFDILGTEAYIESSIRGLTMMGWFNIDVIPLNQFLMSKWGAAAAQRAYTLTVRVTGEIAFTLQDPVSTQFAIASTNQPTASNWHFIAAKYIPSTSMTLFLDNDTFQNTTSIPASIKNSTGDFAIGAFTGGGTSFGGKASMCVLCASALPDYIIRNYQQASKDCFGVA